MSDIRVDGSSTLMAFVAGTVIGVGIGLLVAPRPGKDTREQLADFAQKALERAGVVAGEIRNQVEEGVSKVRAQSG